jgi:DNA-binding NtrC family response regulator
MAADPHLTAGLNISAGAVRHKAVAEALSQFRWPGTVRELRAFLINLSVYADGRPVTAPLVRATSKARYLLSSVISPRPVPLQSASGS